jgi:predicted MPP superfamily phosphohydrolase
MLADGQESLCAGFHLESDVRPVLRRSGTLRTSTSVRLAADAHGCVEFWRSVTTKGHSGIRRLFLHDIWRNLALFLGVVQIQILNWLSVVAGDGAFTGFSVGVLTVGAMVGNYYILPIIRHARSSSGVRRVFGRLYMNLGIATLLIGLAVLSSWLVLYPVALGLGSLGWLGSAGTAGFDAFRVLSAALVASVAAMFVWGISFGQRSFGLTHVPVELRGLDPSLRGLRIAQISDLHIGNGLEGDRLERVVAETNRIGADVIVLTGDLFDSDPSHVDEGVLRLAKLRARHGVYAVLGNHDTYTGSERIAMAISRLAPGIRLLRDEWVALPVGRPLYLAGVDDPGTDWTARDLQLRSLELLAKTLPDDGPTVLLVHRPEAFRQASRLGFPLVLAGHTHGGQIALPLPGGRLNPARIVTPLVRGLYRHDDSILYVNRGVGMAGPRIRFNCSREITTIELG